jgi:cyclopropane fatty-acyl-phospholipid synthase-like methyltransferase
VLFRGRNPAAAVYESIGADFFLSPAPRWFNLGLWEGSGTEEEAPAAVRRLVEEVAGPLPRDGVVLDVGTGLGVQDPVIAEVARPRTLIALNVSEWQLREGRASLSKAGALAIAADAVRIPLGNGTVHGVISVEAAFHFPSRRAFFAEAYRVLKPGGVLTMSDVSTERLPRGPAEALAGLAQLRVWGLNFQAAASARTIADTARAAGLVDVEVRSCGHRVIGPALALTRARMENLNGVPASKRLAVRILLAQVELLWRRGMIDYLLLSARKP